MADEKPSRPASLGLLTDKEIRNCPIWTQGDYYLTEPGGLRLVVKPSGAKYWRFRYRFAGIEKQRQ